MYATNRRSWNGSKMQESARCALFTRRQGSRPLALLEEGEALVDHVLYWIACRTIDEANHLWPSSIATLYKRL